MDKRVFRVAVLGSPQTEQWLLVQAFAASRKRACAYELVADPASDGVDMYVVDSDNDLALARWVALDPKGRTPTAFFHRVHPRAKSAVEVRRPLTSGMVVNSLDQLARRFLDASHTGTGIIAVQVNELAAAAA